MTTETRKLTLTLTLKRTLTLILTLKLTLKITLIYRNCRKVEFKKWKIWKITTGVSEYKFRNLHSLTDWWLVSSRFCWRRHDVSSVGSCCLQFKVNYLCYL